MTTKFMTFRGPTFDMLVPTNWLITSSSDIQAAFVAPESGETKSNLVITMRGAEADLSIQRLAETIKKKQQQEYTHYEVVAEKDWSKENYQAYEHRYKWYNEKQNLTINQRQVFILYDGICYTLTTTSFGDVVVAEPIEKAFVTMLNSFKIR